MTFAELPIGARFKFFGKVYSKLASSMADDENRTGHYFPCGEYGEPSPYEVEVLSIPENAPPLERLTSEPRRHWASYLAPSPLKPVNER